MTLKSTVDILSGRIASAVPRLLRYTPMSTAVEWAHMDQNFNELAPKPDCLCPECGHRFRGNGFDGIDAHWRAKHESVMPYCEAWTLIKSGNYARKTQEP